MENKIYIQEIEKLNYKISLFNLIYKYFKIKWWLVIFIPILVYLLGGLLYFFYQSTWLYISVISLSFVSFFYILPYMNKKRELIIEQKYSYAIQEDKYIPDRTIPEIQKKELKKFINNGSVFKKDKLTFIIDSLNSKKEENKYLYTITFNAIILFISVLLVLLSRFLEFTSYDEFKSLSKIIVGISFLILMIVIYIDIFLRDWIFSKRKKQNQLIRTLENIYLEVV